MLATPQIVRTETRTTAFIHLTVPRAEIREVMGPGLMELQAAVAAQGLTVTGPWFTHHHKITLETFDFEISLPVSAPIKATGRVQPGEWPAMTVARTVYHGPYEGLGEAWGEFGAWIAAQKLTPAEDLWECYLTNPETHPDATAWQTELNRPLKQG